jgi:sarcosine oxidase subunit beta
VLELKILQQSWAVFKDFAGHLQDEDASAGLVRCGYLIAAPQGPKLEPLAQSLAAQQAQGIEVHRLNAQEASERLPICRFDDAALIGFEPEAGFADAYLVASSYARAARRLGVKFMEG